VRKKTLNLLRRYYFRFYYRGRPEAFWQNWRRIKKAYQELSRPDRHTTNKKMRKMLKKLDKMEAQAVNAAPAVSALQRAASSPVSFEQLAYVAANQVVEDGNAEEAHEQPES